MADNRASYEKSFSEWLARQVSPAQLSAICFVFTGISEFCLSRKILKKPLFETDDLVTLADVRDTVERNKDFAISHRKQKIIMVEAIRHYCRFIREENNNGNEMKPEMDSPAAVTMPPPSEIEVLLSEEVFLSLRGALTRENIRTIEELKALKLWPFMNRHNLYSLPMRQAVLDKVWGLLEMTAAVNRESLYEPHRGLTVCSEDNDAQQNETETPVSRMECSSVQTTAERYVSSQEIESVDPEQMEKAEKIVRNADMNGITCDSLYNALRLTRAATKALVQKCKPIVEIRDKLYHEEAFADWDDGARQMCCVAEKLMRKNNGYISAGQLYDYTRAEMSMFLNDNDLNDERSVYEIARHLFEKNSFAGKRYSFIGKAHISKSEDVISSNFDIICKFADDKGGVFREDDLTEYLTGIGIRAGNLRNQMRLGKEPEFFFCEPGTVISAKSMSIDDSWKENVRQALNKLFSDADDHIVLRQIQPVWYESLPALPEHRHWTPLLLQYILCFYGKEFGAKTIMAMKSQSMDTIHAMLVKTDSPIQNFGDAVIACLIENEIEQRSFEAEELRQFLVKTGMIQGNELIGNMPKALEKDERFAWDAPDENVTVRVG